MGKNINDLREREKELQCIYRVNEALKDEEAPLRDVLKRAIDQIPDGWQYPGLCMVKLEMDDYHITTNHFFETNIFQSADIIVDENIVGQIFVYYSGEPSQTQSEPYFLPEEQHLLNDIACQIAQAIFIRRLKQTIDYMETDTQNLSPQVALLGTDSDKHWRWRLQMVEKIADATDFKYYGVKNMYLIGSVKDANAGPMSDIDLLIHVTGDEKKEELLKEWIAGWGYALAQINYDKTGYLVTGNLIDLHIVYTDDIRNKTNSYAAMIGSVNNSARLIK
ncbi:MAG: nucleotidyltransferase domain-containing protein [Bacteroidota bacterium]